jgi:zinc transport system ATP-binding protein
MSQPLIRIDSVSVTLGQFPVLQDVTALIPYHSQTFIIGPNGAGKSTLVQTIIGHLPFKGSITFSQSSPRFGYVPQRLDFDRHMPIAVREFLALSIARRPLWLGLSSSVKRKVTQGLEMVKACALYDKPMGALSGGETQRVLLAAALLTCPDILILDEPATGVDVNGEALLCELLDSFKNNYTIVMVSHDLPTAKAHSDWVICLNRKVIAQGPPADIFKTSVLSATFGLHQGIDL